MNVRSIVWRVVVAILLAQAEVATAGTNVYSIRNTAVAGVNNIVRVDSSTGAATTVYTNYPGGGSDSMAQCPNGLIYYYTLNGGFYQLYVFNPHTPSIAPTTVGGGQLVGGTRLGCSPGSVLYYFTEAALLNLNIVNKTSGGFTGIANTATGFGAGGDIAFDSGGTMYLLSSAGTLSTVPLGGGAVVSTGSGLGAVSGLTGSVIGLAFDGSGALKALTNGSPNFYTISTSGTPTASPITTLAGSTSGGDLSGIAVADPDLSITKTANLTFVTASTATPVVYTVVATNNSAYAITGTVTDTLPAGVSAATWTCSASSGSTCGAASGSGSIATTATLAAAGTATYTINATITSTGDVVNTATVALPFAFLTDATPANNTATNTIRVRPTVTKTFGASTIASGGSTTLTIAIGNPSASAITLSSALTDTLPTSPGAMTVATAGSSGTCSGVTATAGSGSVTMASGTSIAAGGCTIVVNVTATVAGSYTNTIAAGQLSTSAGTNVAATSATLSLGPLFTVIKSSAVVSDPFNGTSNPKAIPGGVVSYAVVITNTSQVSPDSNATVIIDAVPTNTSLYVGNLGSPAGPVTFSGASSGMTYTYTSLSSTTDDVDFSNTGCTTFTYTPVPDGSGFDTAVRCIRINPKGVFANSASAPFPSFQVGFRVRVN